VRGDVKQAEGVLTEIDALRMPATITMGPEVLRARAWTEVAKANTGRAISYLREAVEMAHFGGAYILESAALHDFVRLGHPREVVSGLEEIARTVEGPMAPARAAHARALTTRDPLGLEVSSTWFEELEALLFAAEASADAAVAWRQSGDPRKATAAERRSATLAARCEGARTPALATVGLARATLTRRELEIARLAAAGLSNKEIAQRLYLSHRTVENKLHAAYEKLGVEGRAELAQALEGP
jgi:DNA-binding CsgD family transcriptional regulator